MKFIVTLFDKKYKVDESSYHRAKSVVAKLYNDKARRNGGEVYPISYLTDAARAEKVERKLIGRTRTRVVNGPGSN